MTNPTIPISTCGHIETPKDTYLFKDKICYKNGEEFGKIVFWDNEFIIVQKYDGVIGAFRINN